MYAGNRPGNVPRRRCLVLVCDFLDTKLFCYFFLADFYFSSGFIFFKTTINLFLARSGLYRLPVIDLSGPEKWLQFV